MATPHPSKYYQLTQPSRPPPSCRNVITTGADQSESINHSLYSTETCIFNYLNRCKSNLLRCLFCLFWQRVPQLAKYQIRGSGEWERRGVSSEQSAHSWALNDPPPPQKKKKKKGKLNSGFRGNDVPDLPASIPPPEIKRQVRQNRHQ